MSGPQVLETVVSIKGVMSDSVRKSVADVRRQFGLVDQKTIETAKRFAAVGAAAASAAAAMTAAIAKKGGEFTRAMNGIAVQTGATGEQLKEFQDIATDIYASGKGESLQEVADALTNIRQASGLAGAELKAAANNAVLLKDSFGMETEETTRAATALMKNFGISANEAYGIIAAGAQKGANKNGDLLDTLNEYSVHYKALGLNANQFVSSLINGAEAGSFSIDKIGDAVKEFTIRSKDGSKSSAEAFKSLGLDAKAMTAQFAAGGRSAEAAFFQTVKALDAMKDPVEKNAAGVALFGTMFEDLESGVLKTLSNMKGSAIDAEKTLRDIEKIKYNDLGYAITQVGRSFETSLIPYAEKTGQAIFEQMPKIQGAMKTLAIIAGSVAEKVVAYLPPIIDGLTNVAVTAVNAASVIADHWGLISPVLYGVAGAYGAIKLVGFTKNTWLATKAVIANTQAAWGQISALNAKLVAALKDKVVTAQIIGLYAKDAAVKALSTVRTWASVAAQIAQTTATVAWSAAAVVAQGATMMLGAAFSFLVSPIGLAVAAIAGLVAAGVWLYKNWDTVKEKAAQVGEWLSDKWGGIRDAVSARVTQLGAALSATWSSISTAASGYATQIGTALSTKWAGIKETVGGYAAGLGDLVSQAWTRIQDGASALGTAVLNSLKGAFASIPDVLKAPINTAITLINSAIDKINGVGFKVPDWVPGIGGEAFSVNVPTIPMLARGGFTKGPSIAGEAGQEAVISFDPAYRTQNVEYVTQAASMLGLAVQPQAVSAPVPVLEAVAVQPQAVLSVMDAQPTRSAEPDSLGYYAARIESLGAADGLNTTNNQTTTINLGGVNFAPTVTVAGGSNEKKESIIEQLRNSQSELLDLIEDLLATKAAAGYSAEGVF